MKIEKYIIVGTGPSVKALGDSDYNNIPEDVMIISVNSSILFLPAADIWFTLDDSARNKKYAKIAEQKGIPVVMAIGKKNLVRPITLERKCSDYNLRKHPKTPKEWFMKWKCKEGLSESTDSIHTGNSLYGALNLAYFDRPKKIVLLGLDGNRAASHGGGHIPNNLSHLPLLFESAVPQLNSAGIDVMNGSIHSAVGCFPRCSPRDALEWISKD